MSFFESDCKMQKNVQATLLKLLWFKLYLVMLKTKCVKASHENLNVICMSKWMQLNISWFYNVFVDIKETIKLSSFSTSNLLILTHVEPDAEPAITRFGLFYDLGMVISSLAIVQI